MVVVVWIEHHWVFWPPAVVGAFATGFSFPKYSLPFSVWKALAFPCDERFFVDGVVFCLGIQMSGSHLQAGTKYKIKRKSEV